MSIYVYLLQQKGCIFLFNSVGLKNDHVLLMPLWFLIARVVSLIESLLNQALKGKCKFSYFGTTLTLAPYFVMIGNIFGYSPLSWLWLSPHFYIFSIWKIFFAFLMNLFEQIFFTHFLSFQPISLNDISSSRLKINAGWFNQLD